VDARTRARGLGILLALLFGAALVLLRQRGPGALGTLWAEDGEVFLQQALEDPSLRGWLRGYAGYLSLAPRMLGSVAATLPIEWAPVVLSGGAALAAAAVAVVIYYAAERDVPAWTHRAALALALLVLPAAGLETANAAANIHWYLLAGLGWVALWRPKGVAGTAIGSAYLFMAATNDPFTVLAAPVVGWRWLSQRRPVDWAFAVALGAGLLAQAAVVLGSAGSRALDPLATPLTSVVRWYGFHVLQGAVFGIVLRDALNQVLGVAGAALLAVLVLAVLLAPAARAAIRRPSLVPATYTGLHLGLFLLPAVLAGFSPARYAVASIMLLYGLAAWGFAQAETPPRTASLLALAGLALVAVLDFAPHNSRAGPPTWSEGLAAARGQCTSSAEADVEIPPRAQRSASGPGKRWAVRIPCRKLEPAGGRAGQ
jgi:hypothetical protein